MAEGGSALAAIGRGSHSWLKGKLLHENPVGGYRSRLLVAEFATIQFFPVDALAPNAILSRGGRKHSPVVNRRTRAADTTFGVFVFSRSFDLDHESTKDPSVYV